MLPVGLGVWTPVAVAFHDIEVELAEQAELMRMYIRYHDWLRSHEGIRIDQPCEAIVAAERPAHPAGNDRQVIRWITPQRLGPVEHHDRLILRGNEQVLPEEIAVKEPCWRQRRQVARDPVI